MEPHSAGPTVQLGEAAPSADEKAAVTACLFALADLLQQRQPSEKCRRLAAAARRRHGRIRRMP